MSTSELQNLRKDHLGRMRPARRLGQGRRARRAMVSGAHGGGEEHRIGGFWILLLADRGEEVGTLAGARRTCAAPPFYGVMVIRGVQRVFSEPRPPHCEVMVCVLG